MNSQTEETNASLLQQLFAAHSDKAKSTHILSTNKHTIAGN